MKKLSLLVCMGLLLVSFYACEKETVIEDETSVKQVTLESSADDAVDGKYAAKWICIYLHDYGRWEFNPFTGFECNHTKRGICSTRKICFPVPVFKPCMLIPCDLEIFDPWKIYEVIDPTVFESFRVRLELDIDPRISSVPFALNETVMGLQFYEKNELMSFKEKAVFNVEKDMVFDAETSKTLGLRGNTVKAGEYPILFNEKNETFNVLLSVGKGFERNSDQK